MSARSSRSTSTYVSATVGVVSMSVRVRSPVHTRHTRLVLAELGHLLERLAVECKDVHVIVVWCNGNHGPVAIPRVACDWFHRVIEDVFLSHGFKRGL